MPNTDPLTGLLSSENLDRRLQRLIDQAQQGNVPLSLIILDVHHLKRVNNEHGWATGDLLVQAIGSTLRAVMDPAFTCWRLGGDAFLVALPTTSAERALGHAGRLLEAMAATVVDAPSGAKVTPVVSTGISTYPEDAQTPRGLVRVADRRMHAAKDAASAQ